MTYSYLLRQVPTDRDNVQVGAINLMIELEIMEGYDALDISGATTRNILIEKPDDTILTYPGVFTTTGVDGLLYHKTVAGDIDQVGVYNIQAYIVMPGFTGYSTPVSFTAYSNVPLDNN